LKIYVSRDSVATQLKFGGIFYTGIIAICPQYLPVKKFWTLVNIWRRYGKWRSGTFFGTQCICCYALYSSGGCQTCVLSYQVSTSLCQTVSTTSARCPDHRSVMFHGT